MKVFCNYYDLCRTYKYERGKVRFDELLNVLADSYRRELLLALLNHNPQDDDDSDPLDIYNSDFIKELQFDILMYHLPIFDLLGIIEYERESEEIVKWPDWDEFAQFPKLIANHRDELPPACSRNQRTLIRQWRYSKLECGSGPEVLVR